MMRPRPAEAAPQGPTVRRVDHPNAPPDGQTVVRGVVSEVDGPWRRLRGSAAVETADVLLEADEVDYNEETGIAEARGRVHFLNYVQGEELWAERADYSMTSEQGTFYRVRGSTPGKIDPRPGILTTGNPFLFEGDWAEKFKNRYYLYEGTLTNCEKIDGAWWTLRSPKFDIIPNDRALAYKAVFRMKKVPLLWAPAFYKGLSEEPRRSGFLTPNFGNSNRRGLMFGLGYYWAPSRSYDTSYRAQYFTKRGFAHTAEVRGKPTQRSDFDVFFYGVDDKGLEQPDGSRRKEGGFLMSATGKQDWGNGWQSRGLVNYLSNFTFRQAFTESFNEAVFSEVNSIVTTTKNWSYYHFTGLYARQDNFQSAEEGDKITVRKLPQVEFDSRERLLNKKGPPVWFAWESGAGLVSRNQPLFQTRRFVERFDVAPRIGTSLQWKGVSLSPYATVRNTYWGSRFDAQGQVVGDNLNRFSQEVGAELILPSLSRVYVAPKWMGEKFKHSIEPRAQFRYVSGIDKFQQTIRFDELEILANTNEVEVSVANRIWTKQKNGEVRDWLTWTLAHRRFFDQDFGGAVSAGRRNVITSSADLTGYTFLDGPRSYSPVVSSFRAQVMPAFGVEYRADFDPLRNKLVNSSVQADARLDDYFFSVGYNKVSCVPLATPLADGQNVCKGTPQPGTVLSPPSNQLRGMIGIGNENRRGWNAGFLAIYDYFTNTMQYANTQVTYNTSCCAYSVQYRRFAFGTRNENQFRVAFVIANIGSFGTLKRQDRLF
jgi:LPS-assembly protein